MHNSALDIVMVTAALVAGSCLVMWMGEQITDKGVGNGISIILLINIISTIPNDFKVLYDKFMSRKECC